MVMDLAVCNCKSVGVHFSSLSHMHHNNIIILTSLLPITVAN